MNYGQQKEVRKFYKEFSERVNDKVQSLEMVSLEADRETFTALNLERTSVSEELWGLLVFCEQGLYFYVHPYESAMSMMFRQAVHGKVPVEQLLAIHALDSVKFTIQRHKWYDVLFSSVADKLIMEFKDKNGKARTAVITSHTRASKVLEKISFLLK